MRILVAIALLAGCDGVFGLTKIYPDPDPDPDPDAGTVDGSDLIQPICFGGRGVIPEICFPGDTVFDDEVSTLTINTTSCNITRTQTLGPELCVHVARNITLNAQLTATGARPLVLIAIEKVTILGTLDVASYRALRSGAGADVDCVTTTLDGINGGTVNGGGGAGGTFMGTGGAGGSGGANGGTPAAAIAIAGIRGGCRGGRGGTGTVAGPDFSSGGGAVAILAGDSITLNGTIAAWGAGGRAGGSNAGAAGGGSGGFIALDAPHVLLNGGARMIARGGGGGEGGFSSGAGNVGFDGNIAANEGQGLGTGGDGSEGVGGNAAPAMPGSPGGGGGGGGGGGFTVIYSPDTTITAGAIIVPVPVP